MYTTATTLLALLSRLLRSCRGHRLVPMTLASQADICATLALRLRALPESRRRHGWHASPPLAEWPWNILAVAIKAAISTTMRFYRLHFFAV